MLGAGCWVLGAEPAHPPGHQVPLLPREGGPAPIPALWCLCPLGAHPPSCPCWAHSILWNMALASPRAAGVGWSSRAVLVVGGEAESLVLPSSPGHGGLTAVLPWPVVLGNGVGSRGLVLVPAQCGTHTQHTSGRGQGQCWQCDGYWSNPATLWDPCTPVGQVRAPGLLELQAETRSGAGLGEAALFSWLPLE